MTDAPLRIAGLVGSLRAGSYNRGLLHAAVEEASGDALVEEVRLDNLPFYDADLDREGLRPPSVERLRAALTEADAVLIAAPEYNHSIPAVLKNALDWASTPTRRSPLAGKPVALMGASPGPVGTARGVEHLLGVLHAVGAHPLPPPELLVGLAAEKFDAEGRLTDPATRARLGALLRSLAGWTRRLAQHEPA